MLTATVSVIGKKNEPLYMRMFEENETYFQSLVYCSLDVFDERKSQDMFIGFLCPVDDWQLYGYMTNTRIKFVAVVRHRLQDAQLRDFFVKLHAAYVDYIFNCFAPLDTDKINSKRFDAAVEKYVMSILEKPPPEVTAPHHK